MTSAVAAEFVMRVRVAFLVLLLQGVVGDQRGGARIVDEGEGCITILISRQGVVGDRCGGRRICYLGEGGVHCEFMPRLWATIAVGAVNCYFGDGWRAL